MGAGFGLCGFRVEEVSVPEKKLADYRPIVERSAYDELLDLGKRLKGKRIAHVNATAYGGGVAELLHSIVPLMRDLGLDVHWFVLAGTNPFFDATKTIHNALQGAPTGLSPEMESAYRKVNEANAAKFQDDFDIVVIHDPQPAPLVKLVEHKGKWIWRCHIDLTTPNPSVIRMLQPYLELFDAAVFSAKSYAPPRIRFRKLVVAPPAIDPLSDKNREVREDERNAILSRFEFDRDRPVINQVGRFDPWKDPLGVIDAYRLVKQSVPGVQLLMIGSMAKDDPEGWLWFERTARHAGDDPDIHFLTDLRGVGALEVNVLQRESDVALAKSLREGFGLVVSEALWKGVPVIGGDVVGIRIQIEDGVHGYLVSSVRQAADRTIELLKDEARRREMGRAGRERVRREFLITRYLRDHLRLYADLISGSRRGPKAG
ncbi:MAG TPA: glycosyltransferase [Thermoplasmata archaeon]|nr:glycosyltransferase [Thermoplasmata archaeon]